jgi:hypothetical protein
VIDFQVNGGIGHAVKAAHNLGVDNHADILVVMAGDYQMDPQYLPKLIDHLIHNQVDFVKGNRFFHVNELKQMPLIRIIGNIIVSFFTKMSTGYWSIADPLNGYTAISTKMFLMLDQEKIADRFDFEVSLLGELALNRAKIADVKIPARYGSEVSNINLFQDSFQVLHQLIYIFFRRIFVNYTLYNFHPISLFYFAGLALSTSGLVVGILVSFYSIGPQSASAATVMISIVPLLVGIQLLLQAITLDIQQEPK